MAQSSKDTYALLFGLAILLGMGLLFWKTTSTSQTKVSSGGVKITEFVRDSEGRVIQVIEK